MEMPVAQAVLETVIAVDPVSVPAVLVIEKRHANRLPEGWHRSPDVWRSADRDTERRAMHGHQLVVEEYTYGGSIKSWFKWIDGHFRGMTYSSMDDAKRDLEGEVEREVTAWKRKQQWAASGVGERRNRS
jgi:hypothetical protein